MRITITGGLGFLGRALGAQLDAEGCHVRLMDIGDQGPQGVDYRRGSVFSAEDCLSACQGADTVVHCAAIHEARQVSRDPLAAIAINVTGTINLFDAAIRAGARRFIFMSSAKVYGDPSILPSVEHVALAPKEAYALSKLAGEHHLRVSQANSGIEVVIVRPFSVYGPGQNLGSGYVGMVLESFLKERRIELPGHADFKRDFVHIDDVTRLSTTAVLDESLSGVTIVNAGSGEIVSLAQLVSCASEIVGYDLPMGYRVPGPETLTRSHADMGFAAERFGFRSVFKLTEGLADTIEWFASNHSRGRKRSQR